MAPAPIIQQGSGLLVAEFSVTHAMHLAGGNFPIVPAMAGFWFWPVAWQMQKPSTWSVAYAPTNTSFNLRLGALATNLANSLTPQVTVLTTRIETGVGVGIANFGAGVYSAFVNQPLNINCGAANGGGSAANAPIRVTVYYYRIRALQSTP